MRIGIDIDGVLTNEYQYIIDHGSKYFSDHNRKYSINYGGSDFCEVFNASEEECSNFYDDRLIDYLDHVSMRDYSKEVINKLKDEGHEIYFITARYLPKFENENQLTIHEKTKNWLEKNNVKYDDIIFNYKKVDVVKKLNIDLLIEDNVKNIEEVSKIIPVFCYDHPYNKDIDNDNVTRVYSWYDIYDKIR
ncbi:MAG: hypothetical protein IJF92_05370 [Bacilli bacterium]|nr:hypothetical protein [Bacilli bacterium]